jgi:hypothetical protein
VAAVGGAVAGLSGGGGDRRLPPPAAAAREATPEAAGSTSTQSLSGGDAGTASLARRVERDARLTLAAPAGDLDKVADQVVDVTDRHRGVVLDSSVSTGADSARGGSFSLRVPASELTDTLRDLSRLGQVRARSQSGHDVTRAYSTLDSDLAAARLERDALVRRLSRQPSPDLERHLRGQLDAIVRRIHELRARLGSLQSRTSYTKIAVTLVPRREGAGAIGGAGRALRGSLRALVGTLALILRVVAVLLPFALLGALAWLAAAGLRRRRREAALS